MRRSNLYKRKRRIEYDPKTNNLFKVYYYFRKKMSRLIPLSEFEELSLLNDSESLNFDNNSIPVNKYMSLSYIYTFDIIAKENISELKKSLKRMENSKYISRHPFSFDNSKRVYDYLDSTNLEPNPTYSWQLVGYYKFEDMNKKEKLIDNVAIHICSFSASYYGIRFRITPTKEFLNEFTNLVEKNLEPKKYITINKRGKLRNGSLFGKGEYPGSIYKTELLNDLIIKLKVSFNKVITKYIPVELSSEMILAPSVNVYKTNISHYYNKDNVDEFFRSLSLDVRLGSISDDGKLGLFVQSEDDISNSINLIGHESYISGLIKFDESLLIFTDSETWNLMYYLVYYEVIRYAESIMSIHRNKALKHSKNNRKSYIKILKSLNSMESELFFVRRILDESSDKVLKNSYKDLNKTFSISAFDDKFNFWENRYNQIIIDRDNLNKSYNAIYNLYQGFLEYNSKSTSFIISIISIIIATVSLVIAIFPCISKFIQS